MSGSTRKPPRVTGPGARLAEVLVVLEVETPFGGWARSLESAGLAWLRTRSGLWQSQAEPRTEDGQSWVDETMEVLSRPDGALRLGRVLALDGLYWEIKAVVPDGPQLRLSLQRMRREPGQ